MSRPTKKSFSMRTFSRQARKASETLRHEVVQLGEVGATFLALWLVVVLLALFALLVVALAV
jgi:hypothetical protein